MLDFLGHVFSFFIYAAFIVALIIAISGKKPILIIFTVGYYAIISLVLGAGVWIVLNLTTTILDYEPIAFFHCYLLGIIAHFLYGIAYSLYSWFQELKKKKQKVD